MKLQTRSVHSRQLAEVMIWACTIPSVSPSVKLIIAETIRRFGSNLRMGFSSQYAPMNSEFNFIFRFFIACSFFIFLNVGAIEE